MEPVKIDINLPPKELKEQCERNDYWILDIPDDMSASEIEKLFNTHIGSPYCSNLVLGGIAEHLSTPIDILEQLANSSDWTILLSLALNPNINDRIKLKIMETENFSVLEHLVYNPTISKDQLTLLSNRTQDETLKEIIQVVLSKKKS